MHFSYVLESFYPRATGKTLATHQELEKLLYVPCVNNAQNKKTFHSKLCIQVNYENMHELKKVAILLL